MWHSPLHFRVRARHQVFHLLPDNVRFDAVHLAKLDRNRWGSPRPMLLNVMVWKERRGLAPGAGKVELERYLKEGERARNIKHLVTGREDRAFELAAVVREAGGGRLLSATSPYLTSAVVHSFSPSDSTSMFRWLSEVVGATDLLRPVGSAVGSLSTSTHHDHVTTFSHFQSSPTGLLPTTSSRDLVFATGLTVSDEREELNHVPTDFDHPLFVLLQPFTPERHNTFPFRTICGLALSLSIGNSREQVKAWNRQDGARGAVLFLERFGTWRRRDEAVQLVNDLCSTPHPSMNLALRIGLRCQQNEDRPQLQEAEDMVRHLVSRYALAFQKLLWPVDNEERKYRTSLIGLKWNPRIEIAITHITPQAPNHPDTRKIEQMLGRAYQLSHCHLLRGAETPDKYTDDNRIWHCN